MNSRENNQKLLMRIQKYEAADDNDSAAGRVMIPFIRESQAPFENRIMPRVYVRRITRGTKYEKAQLCLPEKA